MKILIFDDDKSSVDMLLKTVDWASLGITEFAPVYTVAQAKELFLRGEKIDLMLCDIEAPGENGISLLQWVRERGYPVENIFLTNYAEFSFAYEAIRLDSVEYILKMSPISIIEDALRRAMERIRKRDQLHDYAAITRQQEENRRKERWLSFLEGRHADAFTRLQEDAGSELLTAQRWLPVLCSLHGKADVPNGNPAQFLTHAAQEIVCGDDEGICLYSAENGYRLWLLLPPQREEICPELLRRLVSYLGKVLPDSPVNAYYAAAVPLMELPAAAKKLKRMDAANVIHSSAVLQLQPEAPCEDLPPSPIPTELWTTQLREGNRAELFEQIKHFLTDLQRRSAIDRGALRAFHQDYMQLLYSVLGQEHIQGHRLFRDEAAQHLHDAADRSVFDMMKWIGFSIGRACDTIREARNIKTTIDRVREYIDEHFCERIQRNDISNRFFMSEDYLSHVFKKQFAVTIPQYVNQRRIAYATELLRKGYSVSEVSMECGFENIPYFSTVFKRMTGSTPSEYRSNQAGN